MLLLLLHFTFAARVFGSIACPLIWKQDFGLKLLLKYGDLVAFNVGPLKSYKINNVELASKVLNVALDRPEMTPILKLVF